MYRSSACRSASDMISLRRSEVPTYLKKSEFFSALSEEDDDLISVPGAYLKFDTTVNNDEDASHLLSTLRYWGLSDAMPDLIKYRIASDGEYNRSCDPIFLSFAVDFPYLATLLTIVRNPSPSGSIFVAIYSGEIDIIRCLLVEAYSLPDNACNIAAAGNRVQMLQYLHEECGCDCSHKTSSLAAHYGSLDCMKYLLEAGFGGAIVCLTAAANGNLECLRWAHTHGCELSTCMMVPAVRNDHFDCFVYCHQNGHEHTWPCGVLMECIACGRTDMFMYAVDQGFPLHFRVAIKCTRDGRLDMLIYAHEHGMMLPPEIVSAAAGLGRLEILKYAHEQGCAWYSAVCTNAAQARELECLRYAVEHGCPYDHYGLRDAAVSSNSKEVLRYAESLPPYNGPEEVEF
jgi:hypothetical protein